MKKIIFKNDFQVLRGFEFDDFNEEMQNKILAEHIEFEIETMDENSPYYYLAEKTGKNQTPWFLGYEIYHEHKNDLIDVIKVNNYLFDETGRLLPITYHTKKNKVFKVTYNNHDVDIENI